MTFFTLTTADITAFLMIFVRIGALMISAPVFSSPRVPAAIRAGLSLLIAWLLRPIIAPGGFAAPDTIWLFALVLLREVLVGLVIGYTASIIFSIVQMAGEMQDTSAGFGFAGVVDPMMNQHSAIIGQMQTVMLWLIFFGINGDHLLLRGLVDSFAVVPLGRYAPDSALATHVFHLATQFMIVALRVGAPVIGAVLLADLAQGLLQRTAPQFNIMAVGFQIKIAAALIVLLITLPFVIVVLRNLIPYMDQLVFDILSYK
jgi:flagellar biosynthetic protein FliR